MDLDRARDFVRTHHRAVLTTTRSDGSPQMSPVLVALDEEGRVVVSSRQGAMKTLNVRRRPRAWLLVLSDGFYGDWVQLEGDAVVVDLPDAMDGLVAYYRQISGEHPDWDDYRAAMLRDRRVLIRIDLTRAGPDREG